MPTTFHVTNYKNKTLNMLTGVGTPSAGTLAWVQLYNGTQPANPADTPSGSAVYSSTSVSIPISGFLTAAGGGVSSLSAVRFANASSTVSSITFARIYDASQVVMIDCVAHTSVGGAIISSLNSTVGNPINLSQFSLKLPSSNGTLTLGQTLNDRLVDLWTGNSSTRPDLGINSQIDIYTGSVPASADLPATGTLVASFIGNAVNWFNTAANGSANLASNPSTTANGTGTATYFRWYKTVSSLLMVIQGTVGTSGADLLLNTTSLTSGVTPVSIVEATLSL